jgi:uncharacterized protein (TIGR02246 family)
MLKTSVALGALLFAFPVMAEDASSLVKRLNAQYDQSWNTLDPQKLAAHFAPDAIFIPDDAPAGTGPSAVTAYFGKLFKEKVSGHKLEMIAANQLSDHTIVAASRWSVNSLEGDKTVKYSGDAAQVFEKIGNDWKIKLVSWNVLEPEKQQP